MSSTFADLAEPVVVGLTVSVIPVSSVVKLNFCTVFVVIVVVWFPIAPIIKIVLDHSTHN